MNIRLGTKEDIQTIQQIVYITWPVTYGGILAKHQLDYMLELFYSTAALEKQMDEEGHQFYLAELNNKTVGFADISLYKNAETYKLHKLYVLPEEHGRGLGKSLIDFVINKVKEAKATKLILNVNRFNKAKAFYEKTGFTIIKETDVYIGNGYFMNDFIMEMKL